MSSFADRIEGVDRTAHRLLGGQEITYTPAVGAPVLVTGIYDEVYVLAKGDLDAGVQATAPAFSCRLEDLPLDPEDDEPILTIDTVRDGVRDFEVSEARPDGLGGVVLLLRRVVT